VASHVFTPARISLLRILASQAAISLEGARLYSDLKSTEGYLAEAQRLTHTGNYIYTIARGEMFWSAEIYRIYEFDPGTRITIPRVLERVHPEDIHLVQQFIAHTPRDGGEYDFEHRLLMPDGSIKTLHIVTHAMTDEAGDVRLVGTAMDITASKRIQDQLQASLDEMQMQVSLIENSDDFIGFLPSKGRDAYINAGGRRMVGLEPDADVSGFQISDLRPADEDQRYFDEILPALIRDGRWIGERNLRHFKTNASILVLQNLFFIIDKETGERKGIATICKDISEQQRADEALRKAQADLEQVTQRMTMGELAASIAHELNQPLMAIVTSAETCLLRLGKDQPEIDKARRAAERVVRNGHRAADVIRSIRALLQKSSLEIGEIDVNRSIREILELTRSKIRKEGVSLETCLGNVATVMGDRVQLQQVILNLITNAVEAMSDVMDRKRVLRIETKESESGLVLITVEDTGTGVEPAQMDRIYDAFFSTKPEGMGMGLAICRSIVEVHGGRLWASSRQPHGSIFRFTIPVGTGLIP